MNAEFDSRVTASVLESGWILANASHAAAVVAGFGSVAAHGVAARLVFLCSMLCWLAVCWFAVRVMIDASIFRRLAGESEDAWWRLDALLADWGLRPTIEERAVGDRRLGAIGVWRRQAIALVLQLAILIFGVVFHVRKF